MTQTVGSWGDGPATRHESAVELEYPSYEGEAREFPWADVKMLVERGNRRGSNDEGHHHMGEKYTFRLGTRLGGQVPANETAALMETAPGGSPRTHATELLAVREAIADALDGLDPTDRFIFDALFTRRLSLAMVARQLGWGHSNRSAGRTRVWRARARITAHLRDVLADHPAIIPHLVPDVGTDVPTVTPMADTESSPTDLVLPISPRSSNDDR